jgi:hypothetical protein
LVRRLSSGVTIAAHVCHTTERALHYRTAIDRYANVSDHLRPLALKSEDWTAIEIVADWLELFRTATTLMSSSKDTTISWIYVIFTCLQDRIREQLAGLGSNVPHQLKHGLFEAHMKLAEYMKLFDRSPYYLWATCKHHLIHNVFAMH